MKVETILVILLLVAARSVSCQSEELFLNNPLNKEQPSNEINYFTVNIEEKIPDLQLTIVAIGHDRYSEPSLSIYLAQQGDSFEKVIENTANYNCQQTQENICVVPEASIKEKSKLMVVIAVNCAMKCSYQLEASYTEMREFKMDQTFYYSKGWINNGEEISSLAGWFSVPKDKNILQVRLVVYELFPNAQSLPIKILMNPGKQGVTGNEAKYKSAIGVINSGLITLHQSDLVSNEFSFVIFFPSTTFLLIKLESFDGGIVKLQMNHFTQNELNTSEKMIYQIINPKEGPTRIDPVNKTLVVNIVSQQGYGLIRLSGPTLPEFDDDFVLSTSENIFEQKLEVTSEMRKKLNIGDDLFYLMIQPIDGYMLYLIEVYYEYENNAQIELLDFNIQTHHILEGQAADQYALQVSGDTDFLIDLKVIHKEGNSTTIVKKCTDSLTSCKLSNDTLHQIINSTDYTTDDTSLIKLSQHTPLHNINFNSIQSECPKRNGRTVCVYYIAVINHEKEDARYLMLAEHSEKTTIVKENEIYYGTLFPTKYKYYEYIVPSHDNEGNTIEFVKIVLNSNSKKPVVGANISSKTDNNRPSKEKADLFYNNDYLIIRKTEFGTLNDLKIYFFTYSDEFTIYNVHVSYHVQDKISMKTLILNQKLSDVLDSYESQGVYRIMLWMQYHKTADLLIDLKPISGSFYFYYCKAYIQNELSNCTQSTNNQVIVPKEDIKENTFLGYVQVIPQMAGNLNQMSLTSLQYKIGVFLSDFIKELEKNESHILQLKPNQLQHYMVQISSRDYIRLFMFSDNETVEGSNAVGFVSYDMVNTRPDNSTNNITIYENSFVQINQDTTQKICQRATELNTDCFIYFTFNATKKSTQVIFNANKKETITKLYNGMVHKDEYPQGQFLYHQYYFVAQRNLTTILQILNPLAELDIYFNMVDYIDDYTKIVENQGNYPTESNSNYKLEETGDPYINTIDLENALMDSQNSICKHKNKCLFLISIRVNPDFSSKQLTDEYYTMRMFSSEIVLSQNIRQMHTIKKNFNVYFKISMSPADERYILHVNPIGICEVETIVMKLGQAHKHSYKEKGGNLVVIDKNNFQVDDQISGDYLITISTEDAYCAFYIVGYVTHYQYVKLEAGNYFHTNLDINQQLFIEYSDLSPASFRVEASVEEGSIKMGIDSEQSSVQWNPEKPIISYPENNLKDTKRHTLLWSKDKHISCNRCKYIIAISAIREASLSIVVKNDYTYTTVPAQRMFKVEALGSTLELFHFYPHNLQFSIQVTLLSGSVQVFGTEGYTINPSDQNMLFPLLGVYTSQELSFNPSQQNINDPNVQKHSRPYSFVVKAIQNSVFIISFQSNFKAMHLASGFPYFKSLEVMSSLDLQYKSLQVGYSRSTEFTIYFQNDLYHHASNELVGNTITRYNQANAAQNKSIGWDDFYPSITVEGGSIQQDFEKILLSNSTVLYHRENQNGTFTMKIVNDGQGLVELNEKVKFYVIPHSGVQHLLQNSLTQKTSLQGSYDNFEFYSEGEVEVLIELIQCYGQSILSVSDESTNAYGSHEFAVMAEHPNLYVTKIESGQISRDKQIGHMNYFFTVQNLQPSQYRLRASVYPPKTVYPYQFYQSGDYFHTSYNTETKKLDVVFDGLKCQLSCDNSVFTLVQVQYVFDSDYLSSNNAQGNGLCGQTFFEKHLKILNYHVNKFEAVVNKTSLNNAIDHANVTTSLEIDQMLDAGASKLRVPEFYLSLVGKAIFYNAHTKRLEMFYFPYRSATINVKWIETQREKNSRLALIIGLSVGGVILLSVIGFFIFRWYKKSRRNIRFELSDVNNISMSTQQSNALHVNLNHSLEMKKYDQNYSEFKDEEDHQV